MLFEDRPTRKSVHFKKSCEKTLIFSANLAPGADVDVSEQRGGMGSMDS
jgi:hypothetical protein